MENKVLFESLEELRKRILEDINKKEDEECGGESEQQD